MGIKFQSPIDLSAHRAIRHSDTAQTLEVKVVTKTAAHPEHGNGSSNGYTIDGIEGAYLEFTPGNTYKFDQSDSSNSGHPLLFYEDAAKTTAYTTGVTNNHSTTAPGNSGSYTQIIPTTTTPPVLFYQCSSHSLMGSYVKFGTGTIGDTYSINATQDGNNVDLNLDAASGTDSTVQLTAGTNITLTRNDAQQITVASTASGDTYDLNATQDGNNVDINLTSGSGSDNSTVQLTAGSNVTLTRNGAQEVTIAASGGSQGITIQEEGSALSTLATTLNFTGSNVTASGTGATKTINVTGGGSNTVTVEKNVYTANGSTAAFNTTTAIVSENNVQVYIDGVYQSKDDYTTSGSTVTLDSNPANGAIVELIHMVAVSGVIATDSFTGNGSTTAYVLSMSISNENATQVYLDGVYQSKDNYSTSGSTLTFSTAPSNGTAIEVVHLKAVNATSINQNSFTGNGSDTTFTLSQAIDDENKTFVFIQGVYQEKSTYSISGTTLTFSTAPQNGYTIEVMAFDSVTIGGPTVSAIDWQSTIKTSNFTATAGKGYFVNTTSNTVTVTLPAGSAGAKVSLQDYTGTFNSNNLLISANGSEKIRGLSSTTFSNSTNNARVDLVYQDATEGWQADNIIQPPITVSYLVVAGGAAGGPYYRAGGGGAGGLRTSYGSTSGGGASAESDLTISANTNYTVTVGAGGATGAWNDNQGASGSSSVFSTITSAGGGGGGRYTGGTATDGNAGGSGGGGGGDSTGGAGGGGTANQGYAGGTGASSGVQCGGGGGGAGAVGKNGGTGATDGDGGDGIQSAILNYANAGTASVGEQISGSQIWYAGGGGGGSYSSGNDTIPGKGGGGEGTNPTTYPANGSPATANTGGGGGGASGDVNIVGGAGGSGVVILRYPSSSTLTAGAGLTQSTGSPFTEGSSKVSVFTAGTGNITFS